MTTPGRLCQKRRKTVALLYTLLILSGTPAQTETPSSGPVPALIDTRIKPSVTDLLQNQLEQKNTVKTTIDSPKQEKQKKSKKPTKKANPPEKANIEQRAAASNLSRAAKRSEHIQSPERTQRPVIAPEALILNDEAMNLRPRTPESASIPDSDADFRLRPGTMAPASASLPPDIPANPASETKKRQPETIPGKKKIKKPDVSAQPGYPRKGPGELLNPFAAEGSLKPVSYAPLPGIAIFPVQRSFNKAFSDLPLLFAQEYAGRMALKVPETHIYNPLYTIDSIRLRGLGHVYDQILSYYAKAGQPEPAATAYLLQQIAQDGKTISRLVFVEAELDTGRPELPSGPLERLSALLTDGTPKSMKYHVHSRIQIFDAENPALPMVWAGSWERTISTDRFRNVTRSVYDEGDSEQTFAGISRQMSRELIYVMPKTAYMIPVYDTSVQGRLASPGSGETSTATPTLSEENKQAIRRILQREPQR